VKIAVLGGGGFRVPMVYAGLLGRADRLPVDELALWDAGAGRVRRVAAICEGLARERGARVPVREAGSLEEAVEGARFVLCAVRPGGLEARARDERAALEAGLLGQETVGAAGILFALRSIPIVRSLAGVVADRAPGAFLVNLTNPAGVVTEAAQDVLGERALGVCDSPSALLDRVAGALGRPRDRLRFDYAGLNHFGWLLRVRDDRGTDLLPGLLADPERLRSMEEGRLFDPEWLRDLGMLPNEYVYYYERTRTAIANLREAGATRGEALLAQQAGFFDGPVEEPDAALASWRRVRAERERTYFAEAGPGLHDPARSMGGAPPGPLSDEGGYAEVALDAVEALARGRPAVLVLDVANQRALPFLPDRAVVEVPCLVDGAGVRPLTQPRLPAHARARVELLKEVDRLVLEAARGGERSPLRQAFALHPLCGDLDEAAELTHLAARAMERARV
jgi:6-phospho-beta-glucosidase